MKRGFTLIELLLVISIISIISSILIESATAAQAKAADVSRLATTRQMASAMTAFRLDSGVYAANPGPNTAQIVTSDEVTPGDDRWTQLWSGLSTYMSQVPMTIGGQPYGYYAYTDQSGKANGSAVLIAYQQNANPNDPNRCYPFSDGGMSFAPSELGKIFAGVVNILMPKADAALGLPPSCTPGQTPPSGCTCDGNYINSSQSCPDTGTCTAGQVFIGDGMGGGGCYISSGGGGTIPSSGPCTGDQYCICLN